MAYPRPTLRTMGDVDFLVKRSDFEKAAALLEENGYVLTHEKDFVSHHYGYAQNHISFELHRRIPLVAETDEKWMSRFEEGIDAREWHETEGYRFPTLPVTLNGLVLMLHIDQHLRKLYYVFDTDSGGVKRGLVFQAKRARSSLHVSGMDPAIFMPSRYHRRY